MCEKLGSLAPDRHCGWQAELGSREKEQLSEWGHKVRKSRGLDTGWLSIVLRVLKSVLSFLAHVRLVRETGCRILRQGLCGELGERRASEFG